MNFWPFNKKPEQKPRGGEFSPLVWETNILAMVALVPMIKRFPEYGPIVDSNLTNVWDCLMTIAMTGVAAYQKDILSDSKARDEIKRSLREKWQVGGELFDDYYEYVIQRTAKTDGPWSGVSAMWVADNLRLHDRANSALKHNAGNLSFINRLSIFMNISFGSTEVGLSHYLKMVTPEMVKAKDTNEKMHVLSSIFESFACKTIDFIADKEK